MKADKADPANQLSCPRTCKPRSSSCCPLGHLQSNIRWDCAYRPCGFDILRVAFSRPFRRLFLRQKHSDSFGPAEWTPNPSFVQALDFTSLVVFWIIIAAHRTALESSSSTSILRMPRFRPPPQGTSNSVETTDETELFHYMLENKLITLGWIHTHPKQVSHLARLEPKYVSPSML